MKHFFEGTFTKHWHQASLNEAYYSYNSTLMPKENFHTASLSFTKMIGIFRKIKEEGVGIRNFSMGDKTELPFIS